MGVSPMNAVRRVVGALADAAIALATPSTVEERERVANAIA
jgi:hypothetical protein